METYQFSIPMVISNGSEHKFSFGHENLFTSVMGLLQINAGLLVSINAENYHGHLLMESDCSQVALIYLDLFPWLEHEKDLTAFCRERYNGVWSYNCVKPQLFTS